MCVKETFSFELYTANNGKTREHFARLLLPLVSIVCSLTLPYTKRRATVPRNSQPIFHQSSVFLLIFVFCLHVHLHTRKGHQDPL